MSDGTSEEKKIIVDEDWKTQVQAEKEAAESTDASEAAPQAVDQPNAGDAEPELPPASFTTMVSAYMSQTLYALGQLPDADGTLPTPQLKLARHLIDTMTLLQEKTTGNLSDEEQKMLGDVLHQLRMGYVEIEKTLVKQ